MTVSRVVHGGQPHIVNQGGDLVERKYDATYHYGKVIVNVVAPPPMSEEEKERRLNAYYRAAWEAWNSLPVEEQLRINAECEKNSSADSNKASDEQRRAG